MLSRLIGMAALLCLSGWLTGCRLNLPGTHTEVEGAEMSGPLRSEPVSFVRYGGKQCPGMPGFTEQNQQCATLRISYPRFTAAATPEAVSAINRLIEDQLLEYSDDEGNTPATLEALASMFVRGYYNSPDPALGWELERSFRVVFGNPALLTLNYSEQGYTGGAHPFSGQTYFILEANTGKPLNLANLLSPGFEKALDAAGERHFRASRQLAPGASLEAAGFWFENGVFKLNDNVGVTSAGLVFAFNPYEVAPYALGPSEFTIPYADIRDLIPASSPLASVAR